MADFWRDLVMQLQEPTPQGYTSQTAPAPLAPWYKMVEPEPDRQPGFGGGGDRGLAINDVLPFTTNKPGQAERERARALAAQLQQDKVY